MFEINMFLFFASERPYFGMIPIALLLAQWFDDINQWCCD
jgi:hypothetical protein